MSLDIRTTYLNFLLSASLGIALWYRNIDADRPLGAFLLVLSLVFLFEYGIVGLMNQDVAARLILASFVFSVFLLTLFIKLNSPGKSENFPFMVNLLVILGIIALAWGLILASGSSTFESNMCSWTMNGEFLFGSLSFLVFGLIFLSLIFLAFFVESQLLLGITVLLLLGTIFLLLTQDYNCFGYYFILLLLLLMFFYYFIPFFDHGFSLSIQRPV